MSKQFIRKIVKNDVSLQVIIPKPLTEKFGVEKGDFVVFKLEKFPYRVTIEFVEEQNPKDQVGKIQQFELEEEKTRQKKMARIEPMETKGY